MTKFNIDGPGGLPHNQECPLCGRIYCDHTPKERPDSWDNTVGRIFDLARSVKEASDPVALHALLTQAEAERDEQKERNDILQNELTYFAWIFWEIMQVCQVESMDHIHYMMKEMGKPGSGIDVVKERDALRKEIDVESRRTEMHVKCWRDMREILGGKFGKDPRRVAQEVRGRVKELEAVAQRALEFLDMGPGSTHWEGCDKDHIFCALAKVLARDALP